MSVGSEGRFRLCIGSVRGIMCCCRSRKIKSIPLGIYKDLIETYLGGSLLAALSAETDLADAPFCFASGAPSNEGTRLIGVLTDTALVFLECPGLPPSAALGFGVVVMPAFRFL